MERRVRGRLEVEDAAKLAIEANEFISIHLPQIEKFRARLQERESEAVQYGQQQLKARLEREAEVARKIEEQEQRRRGQLAVNEVIG